MVREYVAALQAADLTRVLALFEDDAHVISPLRERLEAAKFFTDLFADTRSSDVRLLNILTDDGHTAAAELDYDWTLVDGGRVRFRCVDVFRLSESGRFSELRIFYDAASVRPMYEAARALARHPKPAAPS